MSRLRLALLCMVATALIAACGSSAPPPPPPTTIDARISAATDVNPGPGGTPSPIAVRLYELSAPSEFQNATFAEIYEADERTLGANLQNRQELLLPPGGSTTVQRPVKSGTRYIGVLAAFRDIDTSSWRALTPVAPHATTAFTVRVGRNVVSLEPVAANN